MAVVIRPAKPSPQRPAQPSPDPNRIPLPPGRSDVLGAVAIGVVVYASIFEAWGMVGFALVVLVFAAVFPRMEREYELGGVPTRLKGYLAPTLRGQAVNQPPPQAQPPAPPARPPESTPPKR